MNNLRHQSGQVLVVGIVMMLILLLAIFFIFDLHHVMRAKFKTETAQQSAALAAANWQKESLNLIGEINLVKAVESLLAEPVEWDNAAPASVDPDLTLLARTGETLSTRVRLLTEMQSRVGFLGPLVGFAAAQQAAKANGLNPWTKLDSYIERLATDERYLRKEVVQNYRWRLPYINVLNGIADSGLSVMPNVRLTTSPRVSPRGLALQDLYNEILAHDLNIPEGNNISWLGNIYAFVKNWTDSDFNGQWWEIDYSLVRFPEESEIYTVGIEFYHNDDESTALEWMRALKPDLEIFPAERFRELARVLELTWCCYDSQWYPEYFKNLDSSYESDLFDYWFKGGGALRKSIRPGYVYEGPAAYAEGQVDLDLVSRFDVRSGKAADVKGRFKRRSSSGTGFQSNRVRIGSNRNAHTGGSDSLSDYRPGAIAKPLGQLEGETPPIALPVILPVFDNASVMPTHMPIPFNFGVLRVNYALLDTFLGWLSQQDSLWEYDPAPPAGTESFLYALQRLTDGKGFRYYGWNPNFDQAGFDKTWRDNVLEFIKNRDRLVYRGNQNFTGPGWLQEPKLCYALQSSDVDDKTGRRDVQVTDYINGGLATRVYPGGSSGYYVVDSTKHIITNDDFDPTVYRATSKPGGGGGWGGSGNLPDTKKGPPRL